MRNRIRVGVIGTGHLGKIHARLLSERTDAQLVAVVDPRAAAREEVAAACGAEALAHHHELLGRVDAVVVAAPTQLHARIGLELFEAGLHVLMEKPLAPTPAEADSLVAAAAANGCVLQVGHVERFNPAWDAVQPHIDRPRYVEGARAGGYTFRSTDIGVVLDLMIHDLELVLALAGCEVAEVRALGFSVLSKHEDMAQARLTFENGLVANLSASRVSPRPARWMNIYSAAGFAGIDFATRQATAIHPHPAVTERSVDFDQFSPEEQARARDGLFDHWLPLKALDVAECNPIAEEHADFLRAIRTGASPRVSGEHARRAIHTAHRILECIASHRWEGDLRGPALYQPNSLPEPTRRGRRKAG